MCKNKALLLFILICTMVGLLAALMPASDIDHDGLLDSLITEGFILISMLCSAAGLFLILNKFPSASLAAPLSFSTRFLPPPISSK